MSTLEVNACYFDAIGMLMIIIVHFLIGQGLIFMKNAFVKNVDQEFKIYDVIKMYDVMIITIKKLEIK